MSEPSQVNSVFRDSATGGASTVSGSSTPLLPKLSRQNNTENLLSFVIVETGF